MGITAGGNINPEGVSCSNLSADRPKIYGMNVINPLAAVSSGAMMLDTLGETAASKAIEEVDAHYGQETERYGHRKMDIPQQVGDP